MPCEECGGPIERAGRGRPRRFCQTCRPKSQVGVKRPAGPAPDIACRECGVVFTPKTRARMFCSRRCIELSKRVPCETCGKPCQGSHCRDCRRGGCGTPEQYRKRGCRCDACREAANAKQLAYYHRRRAREGDWHPNGPKGTPVDCAVCGEPLKFANPRGVWHSECRPTKFWIQQDRRAAIYERDGWICQLCNEPVDKSLPSRDRMSATLDHIIPRSRGGLNHDENLRLAHLVCNSKRGNRVEEAA